MIMITIKRRLWVASSFLIRRPFFFLFAFFAAGTGLSTQGAPQSIARVWDEEILSAIRIDVPKPPVHARNL